MHSTTIRGIDLKVGDPFKNGYNRGEVIVAIVCSVKLYNARTQDKLLICVDDSGNVFDYLMLWWECIEVLSTHDAGG